MGRFGGPFGGYRDDGSHRDGCSGVVLKNALKRKKKKKCGFHLRAVFGVKSCNWGWL